MAAPENVNHNQFKDHKEVISGIENEHSVQLTPQGISYGEGQFAPASDVSAAESYGKGKPTYLNLRIPTEDPSVINKLSLFGPGNRDSDGIAPSGVRTSEDHFYPPIGEGDSEVRPRRTRWNYHADVPSAMEHLAQGASDRAGHIEAGTVPKEDPVFNKKWDHISSRSDEELEDEGFYSDPVFPEEEHGRWRGYNTTVNLNNNLRSPDTISYMPDKYDQSLRHQRYNVDTGTRERIPDKD